MNIHVWKLSANVVGRRKTENSGSKYLYWFQQMHYFNSTIVQCLSLKMYKIFKSHTPTCFGHLMTIIRESPVLS
jgi:hypothetical protein